MGAAMNETNEACPLCQLGMHVSDLSTNELLQCHEACLYAATGTERAIDASIDEAAE